MFNPFDYLIENISWYAPIVGDIKNIPKIKFKFEINVGQHNSKLNFDCQEL